MEETFAFIRAIFICKGVSLRASLVAELVKNLPAVQKTRVRYLGRENPLEKEMATHSSILVWKISQRSLVGCGP